MPDNDAMVRALLGTGPGDIGTNPDVILPPGSVEASPGQSDVSAKFGNFFKHQVEGAQNLFTTPGDVMQGNKSVEEAKDWGPAMALSMAGKGGAPESGALGIFGGKMAKTANLPKMADAQTLEALGANPHEIWNATGWFKGADNNWRFEIPDNRASTPFYNVQNQPKTMKDYLYHPELYKAYPDLQNVPVQSGGGTYYQPNGYDMQGRLVYPEHFGFTTELRLPSEDLLSGLHEAQHAIQTAEGHAPGTNSLSLMPDAEQAFAKVGGDPINTPRGDLQRTYEDLAYEAYLRHAGEVESRNVELRQPFTPEERKAIPPWTTEDRPRSKQIVRKPANK